MQNCVVCLIFHEGSQENIYKLHDAAKVDTHAVRRSKPSAKQCFHIANDIGQPSVKDFLVPKHKVMLASGTRADTKSILFGLISERKLSTFMAPSVGKMPSLRSCHLDA